MLNNEIIHIQKIYSSHQTKRHRPNYMIIQDYDIKDQQEYNLNITEVK